MVRLIERQDAGFELFCGFECSQHGIHHLVVKRFPYVKFYDLFCLLFGLYELKML